jgi:polyisoprenoid-binding protein YceI
MLHTANARPLLKVAGGLMKTRIALLFATTLLALSLLVPALGSAIALDDKDVHFKATATGGLTIDGKVKKMAVAESAGNVIFTVAAEDIDTGIALRNKHMRGFLEADKYPSITLSIPRAEVTLPEDGKESKGTVRGQFTAHGVTKPAVVSYTIKKKKKVFKLDARFEYDIRDHGIPTPSYLGVSVDPVMPVTAKLEVSE